MELSIRQINDMKCRDYIDLVQNILDEKLNTCSGIKQEACVFDESVYYHKVVDIRWKGDIHFEVSTSKGNGWYYVSRNGQTISSTYHFGKVNEATIRGMQRLINDIVNGRYDNKKTLSEEVLAIVEKRGLTSYMNKTKWKELLKDIADNVRKINISYKIFFEEREPEDYWEFSGDEYIEYINTIEIEWMKINPVYIEYGASYKLLGDEIITHSVEEDLVTILKKHNIPYEYLEDEKVYMVYGYK